MRYLLSIASRPVLQQLAKVRTLCAFDFDGTLAPIVEHPDLAALPDSTRSLLIQLTDLYPCVVITGRSRQDVCGKLKGVPIAGVIGSHGAETAAANPRRGDHLDDWKAALCREFDRDEGVWVEDKGLSLAVHYRQFPRKGEARRRIGHVTKAFIGAHVFGGKEVVNIMEAGAPTKGAALAVERDRLSCEWVLYVGDDDNDEDAFALAGLTVPVRVGRKRLSKARYFLRRQAEIDELLTRMLSLRTCNGSHGAEVAPSTSSYGAGPDRSG
jgi:trehalose 6-phosphate phosphatase